MLGRWPRRTTVAASPRTDLPAEVASLAELVAVLVATPAEGAGMAALSLDVKDPAAAAPALAAVREGAGTTQRLFLCGPLNALAAWRRLDRDVRLVDSTRLRDVREGLTDRARTLRALGAQALNLPAREWDAERVRRVQREGVLAFSWDAHTVVGVRRLVGFGVDAVYGDDVRALLAGAADGPGR